METLNYSICPLEFSFENIELNNDSMIFDEYHYGQFIANRELRGKGDLALFTHCYEIGWKHASSVLQGLLLNPGEIITEKLLAQYEALKAEEGMKHLDFFALRQMTTPDAWAEIAERMQTFNKNFRSGLTIADFLISDGTLEQGDLVLVNDSLYSTIHGKVVWAVKGSMITIITMTGEAFSLGKSVKYEKVNSELIPTEYVKVLEDKYKEALGFSDTLKIKYIEKYKKEQAKKAADQYLLEGMQTAYTELAESLNSCTNYDQLKEINAKCRATKLSQIYRDAWKELVNKKSVLIANENNVNMLHTINVAETLEQLTAAKITMRTMLLNKQEKEQLLHLISVKWDALKPAKEEKPKTDKPKAEKPKNAGTPNKGEVKVYIAPEVTEEIPEEKTQEPKKLKRPIEQPKQAQNKRK